MRTEEEARQRWCPFARVSRDGSGNRYPMDNDLAHAGPFARCIASDCMAWRWLANEGLARAWSEAKEGQFIDGIKMYRSTTGASLKDAKLWADEVKAGHIPKPSEETVGFCGLAGTP